MSTDLQFGGTGIHVATSDDTSVVHWSAERGGKPITVYRVEFRGVPIGEIASDVDEAAHLAISAAINRAREAIKVLNVQAQQTAAWGLSSSTGSSSGTWERVWAAACDEALALAMPKAAPAVLRMLCNQVRDEAYREGRNAVRRDFRRMLENE